MRSVFLGERLWRQEFRTGRASQTFIDLAMGVLSWRMHSRIHPVEHEISEVLLLTFVVVYDRLPLEVRGFRGVHFVRKGVGQWDAEENIA